MFLFLYSQPSYNAVLSERESPTKTRWTWNVDSTIAELNLRKPS